MTREEAICIVTENPEAAVEILLRLSQDVEELKRQVAFVTRDSSNSSLPPSSDGPKAKPKPKPKKKSKKRRPGGQPGHKGANLRWVILRNANLSRSNFFSVDLINADMSRVNLEHADLF